MKLSVINWDKKPVEDIEVSSVVFDAEERLDILAKVVDWQLLKRKIKSKATKGISNVRGSNKKPFSQKGTGRSRAGSTRDVGCRGGAIAFGPSQRDFGKKLPKKVRKLGLRVALSSKIRRGELLIIDSAEVDSSKTSEVVKKISAFNNNSLVFIGDKEFDKLSLAVRNIPNVDVLEQVGANVYDIIRHDEVVITKKAIKELEERLVA